MFYLPKSDILQVSIKYGFVCEMQNTDYLKQVVRIFRLFVKKVVKKIILN